MATTGITTNAVPTGMVFDVENLTSDVQLSQLLLADQVQNGLNIQAQSLKDRAAALQAMIGTAWELRTRRLGSDPAGKVSLGSNFAEGARLLRQVNEAHVPATASTSYLWLTKTTSTGSQGQQVETWSASWQPNKLSDAIADGSMKPSPTPGNFDAAATFDTADWPQVQVADSDAAVILADGAQPSACTQAVVGDTTTYCFEADARVITTNAKIEEWASGVDRNALKALAELSSSNSQTVVDLEAYETALKDTQATPDTEEHLREKAVDTTTVELQARQRFLELLQRHDNSARAENASPASGFTNPSDA